MSPGPHVMPRAILAVAAFLCLLAGPLAAKAQSLPDLAVEGLSIHATMPGPTGERQVTTSFRIVNRGTALAPRTVASIQSAAGQTFLDTPALEAGATAFLSSSVATTAIDFTISVTADAYTQLNESSTANNFASYHFIADVPAVGRWRPIGPSVILNAANRPTGVGRITTIAVDPTTTSTLYAGSRGTGLWKTTDGGTHWEPLTDAIPTTNVNVVAVDPNNALRVFFASPAGIFYSEDGGHVWTQQTTQDLRPKGVDGGALIVHARDPRRLYLSTLNGLRISFDAGVTWQPPLLGGSIDSLVGGSPSAPDRFFATVVNSPAAGVYETITGGLTAASWRKLQGCAEGPLPTFGNGSLWVTQSGVTQWVSFKAGTYHELWRTTSRACRVNGMLERAWELLSSGDQTPCIEPASQTPAHWSFLRADPANSRILYKAGVKLCRSTDGGVNFQEVHGLHVDHHAIAFHPLDPGFVFLGNDGGLYRSQNSGQSFDFVSEGLSVTEFLDLDFGGATAAPRVVIGGTQDNVLPASDGSTPAWHAVNLGADPDGDRTTSVFDPLDVNVQYTIGQAVDHFSRIVNGVRDPSFDTSGLPQGCLTYDETPNLFTQFIATTSTDWHLLMTVGPDTPNAICGGGVWTGPPWREVFRPDDGEVLTRLAYDPAIDPPAVLFLAGGNRGSIYINFSPDFMAKVWTSPLGGSVTAIVRDPSRPSSYFVSLGMASGPGRVFEISPEAPLRFSGQDITANLPTALVMTLAASRFEQGVLYAGTKGQGVFRGTRDATGQWSWEPYNNGMPAGAIVTNLRVDAFGTVRAGTYGRGAFELATVSAF